MFKIWVSRSLFYVIYRPGTLEIKKKRSGICNSRYALILKLWMRIYKRVINQITYFDHGVNILRSKLQNSLKIVKSYLARTLIYRINI